MKFNPKQESVPQSSKHELKKVENIDSYEKEKILYTLKDLKHASQVIENYLAEMEKYDDEGIKILQRSRFDKLRYENGLAGPNNDIQNIATMFESALSELKRAKKININHTSENVANLYQTKSEDILPQQEESQTNPLLKYDILPEGFDIPINSLNKSEDSKNYIEFDFKKDELLLKAIIEISPRRSHGYGPQLKITFLDKTDNKQVADFEADYCVTEEQNPSSQILPKKPEDRFWDLRHREVDKDYREKGIGLSAFYAIENIIQILQKNNPEFRATTIEVGTLDVSVARVVVDQDWLLENGLGELAHKDGSNLQYKPYSKFGPERAAKKLLSIKDRNAKGNYAIFRKKLQ